MLDYPSGSNVTTRILARGRQKGHSREASDSRRKKIEKRIRRC